MRARGVIGWTSDSRSIYVYRRDELPAKVIRVDVATGGRATWKELTPTDRAGIVGIRTLVISPDGQSYEYSYVRVLSDLFIIDGVK